MKKAGKVLLWIPVIGFVAVVLDVVYTMITGKDGLNFWHNDFGDINTTDYFLSMFYQATLTAVFFIYIILHILS